MTPSQLAARDIETARRWYVASIGTPYEASARKNMERVVEYARSLEQR